MENPKIRIESDGIRTYVYLDGKEVKHCTSLNFHANVDNGVYVQWNGTMLTEDENGHLIIENDEIVTKEFHYDSRKVGDSDA